MTILKARIKCDLCGERKTQNKHQLSKWDACWELRRGFKLKAVDVCPKCADKPPPDGRVFIRALASPPPMMEPEIKRVANKYMA